MIVLPAWQSWALRGGPVWTPASLGPKWFHNPTDLTQRTYAAQPVLVDPGFDNIALWSGGTNWVLDGKGRHTSTGVADYLYETGICITGNRYLQTVNVESAAGSYFLYNGNSLIVTDTVGSASSEVTAAGANMGFRSGVVMVIDDHAASNLSLASLDPDASSTLTGSFANATATAQGYEDSSDSNWVVLDGTADLYQYDGSAADWTFLHYSATTAGNYPEFTLVLPVTPNALPGNQAVFYDGVPGIRVYITDAGRMYVSVWNATGGLATALVPDGTVAAGVPFVLVVVSDGVTLKVYMDGVEVASDTYSGTPTNSAPTHGPTIGAYTSSLYLSGKLVPPLALDYAVDATQREQIFRWYSDKLSIPLATDALSDAELATWDGLQTWVDPFELTTLTYADTEYTDDFEAGIGGWIAYSTGTIHEETSDVYAGAKALRCEESGSSFGAQENANRWIVGGRYTVSIAAHSTSQVATINLGVSANPQIIDTSWAAYSTEVTSDVTRPQIQRTSSLASPVYVDNYVLTPHSLAGIDPKAGALTDAFANATAANQTWVDPDTGLLRADGVSDYQESGSAAADWAFLHDGNGSTLIAVFDYQSGASTGGYIAGTRTAADGLGIAVGLNTSLLVNAASVNIVNQSLAQQTGTHIYEATLTSSRYEIAVDGTGADGAPTGATSATASIPLRLFNSFSVSDAGCAGGLLGDVLAFNRVLSGTERYRLRVKLAAKHSITLP